MVAGAGVLQGRDPVDLAVLPVEVAVAAGELFASVESDRWGGWLLASGLVDAAAVSAGGPAALDAVWVGVLSAVDAGWFGSCTWGELAAAGPVPLWCRLRPGFEEFFGAAGCWVTAGAVALSSAWMVREWGASWCAPAGGAAAGVPWPVVAVPGGRGFDPLTQVVSKAAAAAVGGPAARGVHVLRDVVSRCAPGSAPGAGMPESAVPGQGGIDGVGDGEDGPDLDLVGPGEWLVSFSDVQAHAEDARIDRLVVALAAVPGVRSVYREDREVVVVESPLGRVQLQAAADAAWAAVAVV